MENAKKVGAKMDVLIIEDVQPTLERLRKNEEFIQPLVDSKNNRRVWRRLDLFQTLLRDNKIQSAHHDAGQRFLRHYMGRMKIDVRVTSDFTVSNQALDGLMDPWQWHGACLAEARQALLPDEFSAMEYLSKRECSECGNENPIIHLGNIFGGYRSRKEASGYGLRLLVSALERLAFLWGLKVKGN